MEIEARVKVEDFESLEKKLKSIGAEFFEKKKQVDSIYKPKGTEFESQGPGSFLLRIRKSKKNSLTYKSLTKTTGAWIEYETEITNPEEMEKILLNSGFALVYTMTKERLPGKLDEFEICLDNIKELGKYIEVALESDNRKEARNKIEEFFLRIGFDKDQIIYQGYGEMMFKNLGVKYNGLEK